MPPLHAPNERGVSRGPGLASRRVPGGNVGGGNAVGGRSRNAIGGGVHDVRKLPEKDRVVAPAAHVRPQERKRHGGLERVTRKRSCPVL